MSEPRILCVKPKTLSRADKIVLRKADVIVIELDEPSDARMLSTESPPMNGHDLFRAAMLAIAASSAQGGYTAAKEFVNQLAAMSKAAGAVQ